MPQSDSSPALTLSMPQAFALCCKAAGPLRVRALNRATGVEEAYAVGAPYAFIGRSPACGVRLNDPSVSQCHAYLQVIEGAPYCIDLGSRTGVIWEDGTQGQGWVGPDQALRIGSFDVRVEGPHTPPLADTLEEDSDHDTTDEHALPTAFVELHAATSGSGRLHPLDRPITLVGRHPTCDLRLLDEPLAYFQCALVNTSDGVWLVDTLTPKGAILNGRGTRLARVRDGDLVELGKVSLLVRIGAHHANRAALAKTNSLDANGLDPVAMISARVAESVAGAFVPVGEMMKQFQQCFMTMAQMFVSMQQDHATVVSEQMRQLQEMASELRELRTEVRRNGTQPTQQTPTPAATHEPHPARPAAPTPASAQPATPTPPTRNPSLKPPVGSDSQTLADAHAWFMDRLLNKGQNPPAGS